MGKDLIISHKKTPSYKILIRESYDDLLEALEPLQIEKKKICIVTDTNVAPQYLHIVKDMLEKKCSFVCDFVFESGEENKTLDTVGNLYKTLIEHTFDRGDILFALGGGVVGDLTGYTAATYLRGIDFVQLPTTLLSQVDSSVGGKTGVDFDGYKNMVGAFYMPKLVYMNVSTLHSLDSRILLSGMGEVIKYGLIKNKEFYQYIIDHIDNIKSLDYNTLEHIIYESCQMKKEIVEADAFEKGERALLNFGHTLGHSIEKNLDFSMYHGECVSLGMIGALYICWQRGYLAKEEISRLEHVLQCFHLPIRCKNLAIEDIVASMKHDKKVEQGILTFILLQEIGCAFIDKTVNEEEIYSAMKYLLNEK